MDALQIEALAEGRAEGRQRQQADGQGIGADMLQELPRHQRAQRNPEQHQHGLGQDAAAPPAACPAIAAMPTAIMAPEISPPGRCANRNSAPPAVPITSVSSTLRVLAAAGDGKGHRCGDLAHAALWQIREPGTNAPARCSNARPSSAQAARSVRRHGPRQARRCGREVEAASSTSAWPRRPLRPSCIRSGISCAPCHAGPWRRLPSSIRARPRSRLLRLLFRGRLLVGRCRAAGAAVCANASPSAAGTRMAVAATREDSVIMGAPRVEEGRNVAPRC